MRLLYCIADVYTGVHLFIHCQSGFGRETAHKLGAGNNQFAIYSIVHVYLPTYLANAPTSYRPLCVKLTLADVHASSLSPSNPHISLSYPHPSFADSSLSLVVE